MKRFGKIIGVLGIVLVVLVVALAVLAKTLITPEKIKATVLPLAKDALKREVRLGDVDVSLLSGITLKDLTIQERDGDEAFVVADQMVLKYQLWPLLFMRVVVDEARLDNPRIRIVRNADGSFNFSDLAGGEGDKAQPKAPAADAGEKGSAPPVDLLVSRIGISGGELQFTDHMISKEAPYRYNLSDLNLAVHNLSLSKAFPFEVSANVNGSSFAVDGEASVADQSGSATVKLSDLDVTAFAPYFRDQVPGKLKGLKVDLDLTASGGLTTLVSKGVIVLKGIDITLDALPDAPIADSKFTVNYAVAVDQQAAAVTIDPTTFDFNGIKADVSGKVTGYDKTPLVDLALVMAGLDLRTAIAALPAGLVKPAEGLDPAGSIDARFNLAGAVDQPMKLLRDGTIKLAGVQASASGLRPSLSGKMSLKGDSVESQDMVLQIGDNTAKIAFSASNLLGKPIVASSRIESERFLLDPLLKATAAPAAAGKETKKPAAKAGGPKEEIGPFDIPVKADGVVRIGKTVYQGLNVDNFLLNYRLQNNILTIDNLSGDIAGGTFKQTTVVDLGKKGLKYNGNLALAGVQADPLVNAFFPKATGTVFGAMNMDIGFDGQGTLIETLKRSMSGKGKINLSQGRLTGAGLVQQFATYLKLDQLKDLQFNEFKGSYTIKDGAVQMNSDFSGKDVRMSPQGKVGLDGALDLALGAMLSPEISRKLDKKGEISQLLTDAEGWSELPLKVAGTLSSPKFRLDTTAAATAVKKKAQQELQQKLQEKVFDKLGTSETEGDPAKDAAKKLIDKTFKGLFGN